MSNNPYITFSGVSKKYATPNGPIDILTDVDLKIFKHEKVAIIGPSGSGKTTLLSLLAGLDRPSSGTITVGNQEISSVPDSVLAHYRNSTMGIIFQSFELILPFTVTENVTAPLDIAGTHNRSRVEELITSMRLTERADAYPTTLSGGEKQRVAIARALSHNPPLILADEPTGSLDQETGAVVLDLLLHEVENESKTMVVITHDEAIAQRMDRVFKIEDTKLYEVT
ncbi:MAG: putative ABC transport system ATP-binding protein [Candidatus Azotimanducaceae bacterium]|jgi:putative ABC transport system ATP-binding protein